MLRALSDPEHELVEKTLPVLLRQEEPAYRMRMVTISDQRLYWPPPKVLTLK